MQFINDLKEAITRLSKEKRFSLTIIGVVAVGFGLCLYMYSFLQTIAFKPLPLLDGDRIVNVSSVIYGHPVAAPSLDYLDYQELKKSNTSFVKMNAYSEGTVTLTGGEFARRFNGAFVEPGMTSFTGVQPVIGRSFNESDNETGAPKTVLISHDIWQSQFGGNSSALGQMIFLDGESSEIIGVMPQGFGFPRNSELWLPLQQHQVIRGQGRRVAAYARLRQDVDIDAANVDVQNIMKRLETQHPDTNSSISAFVNTFQVAAIGNGVLKFIVVMVAVVFLALLLLFVNVGNLLLARTNKYGRDTAIRMALGSPKKSIMTLMIAESALLCVLGALSGLVLAVIGLNITGPITAEFTGGKPYYWWNFALDMQTLAIAGGLVLLAVLVTGWLPAKRALKANINQVLHDGSRGGLGKKAARINAGLIIGEVFLSTAILIVSLMLGLSTLKASTADYGAKTDGFMTARIDIASHIQGQEKQLAFWEALKSEFRASQSSNGFAAMSSLPGVWSYQSQMEIEGKEYDGRNFPVANAVVTLHDSLSSLQVGLKEGRLFSSLDRGKSLPVGVITQAFANQHWPGESALGKRFRVRSSGTAKWITVVGVVNDVLHGQSFSANAKAPTAYLAAGQNGTASMAIAVSFEGTEAQFKQQIRKVVSGLHPSLAVYDIRSYEQLIQLNTAGISFISSIFVVFGVTSLLLAATGIFGVLTNTTFREMQEIGIRRAIGATHGNIKSLYLSRGGKLLLVGLGLGIVSCLYITKPIIESFSPGNAAIITSFVVVTVVISLVVLSAVITPLMQILKMQPSYALRSDS